MALKTIVTGYQEIESILPTEVIDLEALAAVGGRVVEQFEVQVQRASLETDSLTRFSLPADKAEQFTGGLSITTLADGVWAHTAFALPDYEITEQVEVADVDPGEPEPPPPATPLEQITVALGNGERAAARAITQLKAAAALALMMGGMSEEATNAAGSALVVQHSAAIQAYILAGGNVVAGQALLAAIVADPPAWWSEPIAAIFAGALS